MARGRGVIAVKSRQNWQTAPALKRSGPIRFKDELPCRRPSALPFTNQGAFSALLKKPIPAG